MAMTTTDKTGAEIKERLIRTIEDLLPPYVHRDDVPDGGYGWTWSTTSGVWTVRWLGFAQAGELNWEIEARPGGRWYLPTAVYPGPRPENGVPDTLVKMLALLGAIEEPRRGNAGE